MMASNLKSDEERIRRIKMVGDYAIKTNASTREIAKYFSENYFKISNSTVADYFQRYKEMYKTTASKLQDVIDKNKEKTIADDETRSRVLIVYKLLKENYSIEEIATSLKSTYFTIYRDATIRLKQLDIDKYNEIMEILNQRKQDNLKKNNK